jgi:hypothetical protein
MKHLLILFIGLVLNSCRTKSIAEKYHLDYDPNHEINLVIDRDGYQFIEIPGHILFYGHSQDFILALQKPTDSIRASEISARFPVVEQKIFDSNASRYWIIEVSNEQVYGPLTKDEYFLTRKMLGVPNNLMLNKSTLSFFIPDQRKDIQYQDPDSTVVDIQNLRGNIPG